MDKVELLYNHYTDTYSIHKESLNNRNRYFVFLFIVMCVNFLFAISPDSISSIIIAIVKENYSVDISSQISIVQTALWLILLYLTMRYFQSNILIERQYNYLARIEKTLMENGLDIDREGSDYLRKYPKMCDFIDFMYKWVFPIFYIGIISIKIISEYVYKIPKGFLMIDVLIFGCCIVLDILYLLFLHCKKI